MIWLILAAILIVALLYWSLTTRAGPSIFVRSNWMRK